MGNVFRIVWNGWNTTPARIGRPARRFPPHSGKPPKGD
jgi:hypothetical protein